MKAAIIYFSGTGNTLRVGEVFKKYLETINYQVDMIDISKHDTKLKDYDLFIAGSPTYTMTSSKNLNDFIKKQISKNDNPKANFITYVTHSWGTSYGHLTIKDFITKIGFKVVGARSFLAPSNFYMFNEEVQPKQSKNEMLHLYKKIYTDVWDLMDYYIKGNVQIDTKPLLKKYQMVLLSKISRKMFITKFSQNMLKVDSNKCSKCHLCVKKCPNNNIEFKNGNITFSNNCTACTRCMHICPKNAYSYKGSTFEQYELRQKPIIEQLKQEV